jgi:hypothetical protein
VRNDGLTTLSRLRTGDGWYGAELTSDGDGSAVVQGVAAFVSIGYNARQSDKASASISGQLQELKELLANASALPRVLAVTTHNADDMLSVITIVRSVSNWTGALVFGALV